MIFFWKLLCVRVNKERGGGTETGSDIFTWSIYNNKNMI